MEKTKIRFLIVDDFSTMRRVIKGTLKEIGYEKSTESDSGLNALNILNETEDINKPNFIICDWNMPNMNGIQLLKEIRKHENIKIKSIPFLIMTAGSEEDIIIEAANSGCDGYIVKPFTADTLDKKINGIFQKKLIKF